MSKTKKTTRKSKDLGPANEDVPEDEIHLAMLIQNAASRGLVSCVNYLYLAPCGSAAEYSEDVVACCALGAKYLEADTCYLDGYYMAAGNNAEDYDCSPYILAIASPSFTLGAAFEQALRPDSEVAS